jgi:NRAMP (natural resistance-associated macrophage protein)-like metal ion transporter
MPRSDELVPEVRGALGTLRHHDVGAGASWKARLLALLAVMGPGVIVSVGNNDAGGVATYAQAGQNFGTSLLWVLILLVPVIIVNQEMVVRLGLVTGVGHAKLIFERFGRLWGTLSVIDLFVLSFLTIVTEFIGVGLAMNHFGVSVYISVPVAAALLMGSTALGSFSRWERVMYIFIISNLAVIPLTIMAHPRIGPVFHDTFIPHIAGSVNSQAVLFVIGMVGTTVTPWQLFFQQSNAVDKRLTPRWMTYERIDTFVGAVITVLVAAGLICATGFGFAHTALYGRFNNALGAGAVADGLGRAISPLEGNLFAIVLLNASIIGAAAVTLTTSYAFGDVFGMRGSLNRGWREARAFYAMYGGVIFLSAGLVLIPGAPLGLFTLAVQALAAVLLPAATVILLMLCNDRSVLGPWVNPDWLNIVAGLIVGAIIVLSVTLSVTTVFPGVDPVPLLIGLGVVVLAVMALVAGFMIFRGGKTVPIRERATRSSWRMPPLISLPATSMKTWQLSGLSVLRAYQLCAAIVIAVKVIQIAG